MKLFIYLILHILISYRSYETFHLSYSPDSDILSFIFNFSVILFSRFWNISVHINLSIYLILKITTHFCSNSFIFEILSISYRFLHFFFFFSLYSVIRSFIASSDIFFFLQPHFPLALLKSWIILYLLFSILILECLVILPQIFLSWNHAFLGQTYLLNDL